MKNENLIHVKIEYEEALQSKKNVLSSEMDLLKIAKIMKEYRFLRLKELKLKSRLHTKIKGMITNIRKLQATLPKLEIPEILKEDKSFKKADKIKKTQNDELEYQLQEIQDKLKSLAR